METDSIVRYMSFVPMCHPDGELIRKLIYQRGHTMAGFARKIGRPQSAGSIRNICSGRTDVSVEFMRQIARGLRVKVSAISDWTGDDEFYGDAETKIPA